MAGVQGNQGNLDLGTSCSSARLEYGEMRKPGAENQVNPTRVPHICSSFTEYHLLIAPASPLSGQAAPPLARLGLGTLGTARGFNRGRAEDEWQLSRPALPPTYKCVRVFALSS